MLRSKHGRFLCMEMHERGEEAKSVDFVFSKPLKEGQPKKPRITYIVRSCIVSFVI